jgi:Ala-tRNA(Pro) deacylase
MEMAIAMTLRDYLASAGVRYDLVPHRHTDSSVDSSRTAHVPAVRVAKAVLVEDEQGYVLAVIPASRRLQIAHLNRLLGRHMGLATEAELGTLFPDCAPGALPPVGGAYGLEVVYDDALADCPDVYFEAGDHENLAHTSGADFLRLMGAAHHGAISRMS